MDKVGRVKLVLKIDGGEVKNVSMNEAKWNVGDEVDMSDKEDTNKGAMKVSDVVK